MDELRLIFGNRIARALHRAGISDFRDLILEWPNIKKDFGNIRDLGKESYQFVEYFLKVELP